MQVVMTILGAWAGALYLGVYLAVQLARRVYAWLFANERAVRLTVWGAALVLYVSRVVQLGDWLIDDAGITFAYARSFAQGFGLTQQPGMPPVEAYSNPLWLFLLAPFNLFGLFEPVLTSKALSIACVAWALWLVISLGRRVFGPSLWLFIAPAFWIVLQPAFLIWTISGLENPLYILLIMLLFKACLDALEAEHLAWRDGLYAGLLCTGLALTRPDGLTFSVLWPGVVLWRLLDKRGGWRALGYFLSSYAVTLGAHFLFRRLYFGYFWPNTYYAKQGTDSRLVLEVLQLQTPALYKIQNVLRTASGEWIIYPSVILLFFIVAIWAVRQEIGPFARGRGFAVMLAFFAVSGSIFLLLPDDWMSDYRFATPAFVFFALVAARVLVTPLYALRREPLLLVPLFIALFVFMSVAAYKPWNKRFTDFKNAPMDPSFARVAENPGLRVEQLARFLKVKNASFLAPDLGGVLWVSSLRIHDLAGLCDQVTARHHDDPIFYSYVFDTLKPSFIAMHGHWSAATRLSQQDRFLKDYTGIEEWRDSNEARPLRSGLFIRRELAQAARSRFCLISPQNADFCLNK